MRKENPQSLYHAVGGKPTLEKVHKIFYDILYAHPWLGQYFQGMPQNVIESQQTDFMTFAMGGPEVYSGKFPAPTHKHMYITEDMFDLRQALLKQALEKAQVPAELAGRWLNVDASFRNGLVKASLTDCEKRYPTDLILNFQNPLAR